MRTPPKIEIVYQALAKKRRLHMIDEDTDRIRVKILLYPKEELRQRLREIQELGDDLYVPDSAQLMLKFL